MDLLLVIVIGVIAVAVVTALAERLGVAGPLLLVALGLAIGLLPFVEVPEIDPELILVGVLPPLLYASAVRLPASMSDGSASVAASMESSTSSAVATCG